MILTYRMLSSEWSARCHVCLKHSTIYACAVHVFKKEQITSAVSNFNSNRTYIVGKTHLILAD